MVGAFQKVFADFDTHQKVRKVTGIRIGVAKALSAMGPALRKSPAAYARAYGMLEAALFSASADEQAAFLNTLSAMLKDHE